MLWVYGHYFFNILGRGPYSDVRIRRGRQILTSKYGPRAERVNSHLYSVDYRINQTRLKDHRDTENKYDYFDPVLYTLGFNVWISTALLFI